MTNVKTEDKWQNAREQAQAQFESIREMVKALQQVEADGAFGDTGEANEKAFEDAQQAIQEDALCVEVRSDWYALGSYHAGGMNAQVPAEYRILLCTGGPAVQITGQLNEHGEPETACLQMQDWFLPWTEYRPEVTKSGWDVLREKVGEQSAQSAEEILLAYARQFYFGE